MGIKNGMPDPIVLPFIPNGKITFDRRVVNYEDELLLNCLKGRLHNNLWDINWIYSESFDHRPNVVYFLTVLSWLNETCDAIYSLYNRVREYDFRYQYEQEYKEAQKQLEAWRSMLIAHPLSTTRHPELGYDGNVFGLDITSNVDPVLLIYHCKDNSDFRLEVFDKQKENYTPEYQSFYKADILKIAEHIRNRLCDFLTYLHNELKGSKFEKRHPRKKKPFSVAGYKTDISEMEKKLVLLVGNQIMLLMGVSDVDMPTIVLRRNGNPNNYPQCCRDTRTIYLRVDHNVWNQFVYQLAHELCHYFIPGEVISELRWFEETLCAAMSLYVLANMLIYLQKNKLSSEYDHNYIDYANKIINEFKVVQSLSVDLSTLEKNPYDRERNTYVAAMLMDVILKYPSVWKAVKCLCDVKTYTSFVDFMDVWLNNAPNESKEGVSKMIETLKNML